MTTANEAWMDALIRHQVGLMRLAPGISKQVNSLLDESEEDIERAIAKRYAKNLSPARLENMLKTIRAARSDSWKKVNKKWLVELEELAQAEPAFLDETLRAVVPTQLDVTLPTVGRLVDLARTTPFEGLVLADWAHRVERNDIERMEQQIKMGLLQGENVDQIVKRVLGASGSTKISKDNADSITRTAVNAISNAAKQEFYQANKDILDLEVFLATLDARTTLVCAGNDNKQFPLGVGPIPPLHWRCRSLRLAIINGEVIGERPMKPFTEKMLLKEYAEKHDLGKVTLRSQLPRGHKAEFDKFARKRARELTGRVPAKLSYDEWLRRQSADYQNEVLGPGRAQLFRDGMKLDKFTNREGDVLTLEQLRKSDRGHLGGTGGGAPPAPPQPPPKTADQLRKEAEDKRREELRKRDEEIRREQEQMRAKLAEQERLRKEAEAEAERQRKLAEEAELRRKRELAEQERIRFNEEAARKLAELQAKRQQELAIRPKESGSIIRSRVENDQTVFAKHEIEEVLSVMDEAGWSRLHTEVGGQGKVILVDSMDRFGPNYKNTNGLAWGYNGNIALKMQKFSRFESADWTVDSAIVNRTHKVAMVAVHELGHNIHLFAGGGVLRTPTSVMDEIDKHVMDTFKTRKKRLTRYSETNHREFFAESFAKFHYDPDAMMASHPEAYEMVSDVLRERGLPTHSMRLKDRWADVTKDQVPKAPAVPVPQPKVDLNPPKGVMKDDVPSLLQRYSSKTKAEVYNLLKRIPEEFKTRQQAFDWKRFESGEL